MQTAADSSALSDLGEFRRLSAALSYMLTAAEGSAQHLLEMILADRSLPKREGLEIVELIDYVLHAWAHSRRRLGPAAALHPLRATALLVKVLPRPRKVDLVVMLLHDKVEDVTSEKVPEEDWKALETRFRRIRRKVDPEDAWRLDTRLQALSRLDREESYCSYLGRLMECGRTFPDVIRAKLADRLDNTLDFSIDFHDPLDGRNFFEQVFESLYVPNWPGPKAPRGGRPTPLRELSWRLYSLYKNVVLVSLLRSERPVPRDAASSVLMDGLVNASLKEAQRVGIELLLHHRRALRCERTLLLDAMQYCNSVSAVQVTTPQAGHVLDGLLVRTFDAPDPEVRVRRLVALSEDRRLLFEGAVTFLSLFCAFRNSPTFRVKGIGPEGVRPVEA